MRIFLEFWKKTEEFIASLFLVLIVIFMGIDVFGREIFHTSFVWASRAALQFMILVGFMGAALVVSRSRHLSPEIGKKIWPKKLNSLLERLELLISAVFCLFFFHLARLYVFESFEFGDQEPVLGWPIWMIQAVIPYVFFSMGIRLSIYCIFPKYRPEGNLN